MEATIKDSKKQNRIKITFTYSEYFEVENLRMLYSFDGRNLLSIPSLNEFISGSIYFTYLHCKNNKKTAMSVVKKILNKKQITLKDLKEKDNEDIEPEPMPEASSIDLQLIQSQGANVNEIIDNTTEHDNFNYIYVLKKEDEKILKDLMKIFNDLIPITVNFTYSELIKNSINLILNNKNYKLYFLTYTYIGNLFDLSIITSLKLLATHKSIPELTLKEKENIKKIKNDSEIFSNFKGIHDNIFKNITLNKIISKEDFDNNWSSASDFNYWMAFLGFIFLYMYLSGENENISMFIMRMSNTMYSSYIQYFKDHVYQFYKIFIDYISVMFEYTKIF